MTPTEYFESQVESNKWLKELTPSEQLHIQIMLSEYGLIKIQEVQIGINKILEQ